MMIKSQSKKNRNCPKNGFKNLKFRNQVSKYSYKMMMEQVIKELYILALIIDLQKFFLIQVQIILQLQVIYVWIQN
jgi:hypothetical protein